MNRNVKYKQVCRIGLFGDDDINSTSNFQYAVSGNITNSKRMRFTLNNSLNDINLKSLRVKSLETRDVCMICEILYGRIRVKWFLMAIAQPSWIHAKKLVSTSEKLKFQLASISLTATSKLRSITTRSNMHPKLSTTTLIMSKHTTVEV